MRQKIADFECDETHMNSVFDQLAESLCHPIKSKNYIDELMAITFAIIVDLALVDGDSSKSEDFDAENKEGLASLIVLISKKWNEVKERHKK